MTNQFDVVVIGSGFGGAVMALRLAEAGRRVLILEQGRRWGRDEFPRTLGQAGNAFWQPGVRSGMLEYRAFRNLDVIQGVGVGGGSLHYFNVNRRAPARVLDRWAKPLRRAILDPYYELARSMLESKPLTPPKGRTLPVRTQVFMEAARSVGTPELLDIAVYTGEARKNAVGIKQDPCTYCGNCMLGCQQHAKNTLDLNYLALAENQHGAEIRPLSKARVIRPIEPNGYEVEYDRLDPAIPSSDRREKVFSKVVVVAAGALGSTELLLRSAYVYKTLPRLSPALGSGFSSNGDMLFAGSMATQTAIDPAVGPSITAVVDYVTQSNDISIEDLGLPDPMLWFVEAALPMGPQRIWRNFKLVARYLWASMGLVPRSNRISDGISQMLRQARMVHFLPFLGMGTDAGDGRLFLEGGELNLAWSHKRSRAMFREMESAMRAIAEAAGGTWAPSPLWKWPLKKLLTAHPLGGCNLGADPQTSVVNHACEVWNYPGLLVTDGAAIPTALAVNPSLTIAAIAERAAFWHLHHRDRLASDPMGH